jgi:hypothetical protein
LQIKLYRSDIDTAHITFNFELKCKLTPEMETASWSMKWDDRVGVGLNMEVFTKLLFYCCSVDEVEAAHSLAFSPSGEKLYCGFKNAIRIFNTNIPGRQCETRNLKCE